MVNYCCVYGCGRNSRTHGHLTFYTLPKEQARQNAWLKACCPEVLGAKLDDKSLRSRRFCSRHFTPSCIKNQRLLPDAVPTLCLSYSQTDDEVELPLQHTGLACDGCGGPIVGFRYKCTECKDFDLCHRCESHEMHAAHCMLRLPKPVDFETAQTLTQKWSNTVDPKNADGSHVTVIKQDPIKCDSSDDEPITKYLTQRNEDWNIPESVKCKIRKEVARAIKASKEKGNVVVKQIPRKPVKKTANTSKQTGIQENKINNDTEIVSAQDLPIKYVLEEIPAEFATEDGVLNAVKSDHEDKVSEAGGEIRQSVMDIAMNDTLSEFLIKRI